MNDFQKYRQSILSGKPIAGSLMGGSSYDSFQQQRQQTISAPRRQVVQQPQQEVKKVAEEPKKGFIAKAQDFFQGVGFRQQQGTDIVSKTFGQDYQIINEEKRDTLQKISEAKASGKNTKDLEKKLATIATIEDPTTPAGAKQVLIQDLRIKRYIGSAKQSAGDAVANIYDYISKYREQKFSDPEYVKKVEEGFKKFPLIWKGEFEDLKKFQTGEKFSTQKISSDIKKWADETAPINQTYSEKLAGATGSMGVFTLMTLASGGNTLVPVIIESVGEAGSVYSQLRSEGKSIDESGKRADLTLGANLVLNKVLNMFEGIDKKKSIKLILKSMGQEGVQEGTQQTISNLATNRKWDEGVLESAIIGSISAGATTVVYPSAESMKNPVELEPQEIKDKILTNKKISNTKDGKELLKRAIEADDSGKKLLASINEDGSISIGVGTAEVQAPAKESPELKKLEDIAKQFTSAKDFATSEGTSEDKQIGVIDSNRIIARDAVDKTTESYKSLYEDIKLNGVQEPIIVQVKEDGTIETTDGSHRVIIAQELGQNVPIIVTKGNLAELQSIKEFYDQAKRQIEQKETEKAISQVQPEEKVAEPKIKYDKKEKVGQVLIEEAKKYGSAEEFVNKNTLTTNGIKHLDLDSYSNKSQFLKDVDKLNYKDGDDLRDILEKAEKIWDSKRTGWGDDVIQKIDPNKVRVVEEALYPENRATSYRKIDKPIQVLYKDGNYSLVDGRHRLEAFRQLEKEAPIVDITKEFKTEDSKQKIEEIIVTTKEKQIAQKKPIPSKGEIKKSKAVSRIIDKLSELQESDIEYNQMNIAEDAKLALDFVEQYPKRAEKIALGLENPPPGVTETAISIVASEKAKEAGNYKLQADLELSRSLRQTRRGQEIVAERGRTNVNSSEYFIKQLIQARLDNVSNKKKWTYEPRAKKGSKVQNAITNETADVKVKMDKLVLNKIASAQSLIDQLTC